MPTLREVLETSAYPTVDIPARFRQEGRTDRQLKSQLQTQKLNRDITEESRRRKKQFLNPLDQYLEELAQSLRGGQQAPIAPPGQQEGGQGQPLTEEMVAETVMGKRSAQPSQGQQAPSLADLLAQQEAQATGVQPDAAQMGPKPAMAPPAQPQQPGADAADPDQAAMPGGGAFDQQAVLDLALATDQISPDQYNAATQKLREAMEPVSQGDLLGKASGLMNQYLHTARLGQISTDPKDENFKSFADWIKENFGARALGKHPDELKDLLAGEAGATEAAKLAERLKTEPQIEGGKTAARITAETDLLGSPAEQKRDVLFGQELAEFEKNLPKTLTDIKTLKSARDMLASGRDDISGPAIGTLPESALIRTNPDAIRVKKDVERIIQETLKQILGAQFTQKEGEGVLSRSYDPRFEEEQNLKSVDALLGNLEAALALRQRQKAHYDKNKTMRGYDDTAYYEDLNRMGLFSDEGLLKYMAQKGDKEAQEAASELGIDWK